MAVTYNTPSAATGGGMANPMTCYAVMAQVEAGDIAIPTEGELIEMLPVLAV